MAVDICEEREREERGRERGGERERVIVCGVQICPLCGEPGQSSRNALSCTLYSYI